MEMTLEKIHIVYAADNGYAPWLGVSLASILINSDINDDLTVYIIDGGISAVNRKKISLLQQIKKFSLFYLDVDEKQFNNCCVKDGYSIAVFYHLLLPEILPTIKKVIYLDCDVLVRCSLVELWSCDVDEVYVGATPDLIDYLPFTSHKHKYLLHMKEDDCYFNAGVMVLNLKRIREEGIFEHCISWLGNNGDKAIYCDQDALNVVIPGACVRWLHPRWNIQVPMYWPGAKRFLKKSDEMVLALNDPGIVHFTTEEKPWKQYSFCKWKSLFHHYCLQTSWSDEIVFEPHIFRGTIVVIMFLRRWLRLRLLWVGGLCISSVLSLRGFVNRNWII